MCAMEGDGRIHRWVSIKLFSRLFWLQKRSEEESAFGGFFSPPPSFVSNASSKSQEEVNQRGGESRRDPWFGEEELRCLCEKNQACEVGGKK